MRGQGWLTWAFALSLSACLNSHPPHKFTETGSHTPRRAHFATHNHHYHRLALRGGAGSSDAWEQSPKQNGLEILPDFMQDLVKEAEEQDTLTLESDNDVDSEDDDEKRKKAPDYFRAAGTVGGVAARKRRGEEDLGQVSALSLEDIGGIDLDTEEGINSTTSVLQSWHELMRERQRNPKLYLKEHPRWQFIQNLENFTAEAKACLDQFDEEVRQAFEDMNNCTLIQRLQQRFPRNVSAGESWSEVEIKVVCDDLEEEIRKKREEEDGPWWMLSESVRNGAMTTACMDGDLEFVKELLLSKANATHAPEEGNWPPLHWAVQFRHHHIFKALIDAGADPNMETDDGMSPLQRACSENDAEGVRALVALGATLRGATMGGLTPMHYAGAYGGIDAAEALYQLGADVLELDDEGMTPRERAEANNEVDAATWLAEREKQHKLRQ